MKKKRPSLTHYTKRLKRMRLARTITIIAAVFVSAVVVAANVVPQVIKTNAASGSDPNNVIDGGLDYTSGNGVNLKAEIIQKVYHTDTDSAKQARALYASFGVTEDVVNALDPTVFNLRRDNPADDHYFNWWSFGRTNNAGYQPWTITYDTGKTYTFYFKPFREMVDFNIPVLKGSVNGKNFLIALTCGNIVVENQPEQPTPKVTFSKSFSVVTRAGKEIPAPFAADFKLQVNDQITYRLYAQNTGSADYLNFRLADVMPDGVDFVRQGGSAFSGIPESDVVKQGVTTNADGSKYVSWLIKKVPVGVAGYTDVVFKVTKVVPQVCNFAVWAKDGSTTLEGATEKICLPVKENAPILAIEKKVLPGAETGVKLGDEITYQIVMKNTGTAPAPGAVAIDVLKTNVVSGSLQYVRMSAPTFTKLDGTAIATPENVKVDTTALQDQYFAGNHDAYGYYIKSMAAKTKITFTVTAKAIKLPKACNIALANYTDSGNPIAVDTVPAVCVPVIDTTQPQVTVQKEALTPAANTEVGRGQIIKYRIRIRNIGNKPAKDLTISDPFPPYTTDQKQTGTTFAKVQSSKTDTAFVWHFDQLNAGANGTIDVQVKIKDDAPDGQQVCNVVRVDTTIPGDNTEDNTSQVCHRVSLITKTKAAVSRTRKNANGGPLDLTDGRTKVKAGEVIEYSLTTTNQADAVLKGYAVVEDLSDVLAYADVTEKGKATLQGTTLIWPKSDIPAKGSIVRTFKVKVKNPIPTDAPSPNNPAYFNYSMFNNYGNDVNIPVEKPVVQQIIDVAGNLPDTGATGYVLIVGLVALSAYFFVRNKQLTHELAAATVEYQHQESAQSFTEMQNVIHPEPETEQPADDTTPPAPGAPQV